MNALNDSSTCICSTISQTQLYSMSQSAILFGFKQEGPLEKNVDNHNNPGEGVEMQLETRIYCSSSPIVRPQVLGGAKVSVLLQSLMPSLLYLIL